MRNLHSQTSERPLPHLRSNNAFSHSKDRARAQVTHDRNHQTRNKPQILHRRHLGEHESLQKSLSSTRRGTLSLLASTAIIKSFVWPAKARSEQGGSLLEKEVSEFTLSNGLHFIVLERRTAPIISCHTHANVGAFEEVDGQTGLAHMLEHEAFKGSDRIGTTNWSKERPLLEAQDEVFYEWREAQRSGDSAGSLRHAEQLLRLQSEAGQYAVANDLGRRYIEAGAVGLNASTSHDATRYHVSVPSNKLELWFALEAERFQASVFRELYSEKRVVLEERRARVDNSPLGRYLEELNGISYGNNYRRPVIGYQADIQNFGRQEVMEFFKRHYVPSKLTISVVGDTNSEEVYRLAEKYFGKWNPKFEPLQSTETLAQASVKPLESLPAFEKTSVAGPILIKGFYRGDVNSDESFMMDVIDDVLTGGRTARFESNLLQKGLVVAANFNPTSPGAKYACASTVFAVPVKGVSLQRMEELVMQQLAEVASHGVEDWELSRIKKATKVDLLEGIRINTSMASLLSSTHALTGSWRTLLSDLNKVEELTSDKIRDTAAQIFRDDNCFTGYVNAKTVNLKDQVGASKL